MVERLYAHRNLNEARRDWAKFIFSYGPVKGNIGRGKVAGYSDDLILTDVTANCQQAGLKAIQSGPRQVAAWLIGTPSDNRPDDVKKSYSLRRFSIHPKLGHLDFRWCDTGAPVQFPLAAVWLRSDGCYSIE